MFEHDADTEIYVIHTAGRIDISEEVSPEVYNVNVIGTKNILALCREYKVKRPGLCQLGSCHS